MSDTPALTVPPLSDLEVALLRQLLAAPVPAAAPPITIGPFTNVPAPGSPIRSDWPQDISTYVANNLGVYATQAAMDAAAPPNGALALRSDTGVVYMRFGGAWQPLYAMGSAAVRGGIAAGTAQTGISTTNRTVATLGLSSVPYARLVNVSAVCRVSQETAAAATFRIGTSFGGSELFGDEQVHGAAIEAKMYQVEAVYTVPANTAATFTAFMIRTAGTATGATVADSRFNRIQAVAVAAP